MALNFLSKEKLFNCFHYYLKHFIALVISIALCRAFEIYKISYNPNFVTKTYFFECIGLIYDFIFLIFYSAIVFIFVYLLHLSNKKLGIIFVYSINIFILIISIISTIHFSILSIPLNNAFVNIPLDDILFAIETSVQMELSTFIAIILIILIYVFVTIKIKFQKQSLKFIKLKIVFILLPGTIALTVFPYRNYFKSDFQYYAFINKTEFFLSETLFRSNSRSVDYGTQAVITDIKYYQNNFGGFDYLSTTYPLLHKNNYPDVLGSYFNLGPTKPNIVIIIMESLSSSFLRDSKLGSYSPFIDSLSYHSLYWENCLATTERSFGVLTSIFGSLPLGEYGFVTMYENMPEHNSLISLLRKNGYYVTFSSGVPLYSDAIKVFMTRQKTDNIISYYGSIKNRMGWADSYPDEVAFNRLFDCIDSIDHNPSRNRLDICLTVSTHPPYEVPNSLIYENMFLNQLNKLHISEQNKKIAKNLKKELSSFIYADFQLGCLFNKYKKRKDFNNTIFIITGDHRSELWESADINAFRVPLIIYSPRLKQPHYFKGVVSHLDITPTLLKFLENNYNVKVPKEVHWLGTGLDTSIQYRNLKVQAFMSINREITSFLYKDYFFKNNTLFFVDSEFKLSPVIDSSITNKIKTVFNSYLTVNNYVCRNNKILPIKKQEKPNIYKIIKAPDGIADEESYPISSNIPLPQNTNALIMDFQMDVYPYSDSLSEKASIISDFISPDPNHRNFYGQKLVSDKLKIISPGEWSHIHVRYAYDYESYDIDKRSSLRMYILDLKKRVKFKVKNITVTLYATNQ